MIDVSRTPEHDMLSGLRAGLSNKEIAQLFHLRNRVHASH